MKSFASGKYADALDDFSDGIKKEGNTSLYAAFIAANLVTGKYPQVNTAYNEFSAGIRGYLVKLYGESGLKRRNMIDIVPYKDAGGNQVPSDFPKTIELQAVVDYQDFLAVKQQIDNVLKK
ncbi:MAG TPA: hypothetical protein VIS48_15915 [Candidatus Kryptonia bacterium]